MSSFVQRCLYGPCEYHTETHDEGDYGSFHLFLPLISYARNSGFEDHQTLVFRTATGFYVLRCKGI